MCRHTPKIITREKAQTDKCGDDGVAFPRIWPVSPWLVLAALPWLPTWCYLNRGYTQWFHWNSFFYCLTQDKWHAKLLALQGLTVTLGWYASLIYDWLQHGRFAHILYWNMPEVMTQYMMNEHKEVVYNEKSLPIMGLAHAFDTLGHPILAFYFWKITSNDATSVYARFSWSVLLAAYLLSRCWSFLHTWYNHGQPALFYFGYDVYTILDRDAWLTGLWLPAYIAEGAVFAWLVFGKLLTKEGKSHNGASKQMPPGRVFSFCSTGSGESAHCDISVH